jgi:hypothetical protein
VIHLAKRGVRSIFTYNSNRAEAEKVVAAVSDTVSKAEVPEFSPYSQHGALLTYVATMIYCEPSCLRFLLHFGMYRNPQKPKTFQNQAACLADIHKGILPKGFFV